MRASMTGRNNLIIILTWDVMNTHTSSSPAFPGSETQTIITITNNNTARGQCISIHYMEQHITMCAFISGAEVNALCRAAGKLRWTAQSEGPAASGFVTGDPPVTPNGCGADPASHTDA